MKISKNLAFCAALAAVWLFALILFPINVHALVSPPTLTEKDRIQSVEFVNCLFPNATEAQANDIKSRYGFSGTDLGIPVYDSTRNRTLIFFGDTFENIDHDSTTNSFPNGVWNSNIMAVSTDTNLSDGLEFSAFYTGGAITNLVNGSLPSGKKAKSVIEGLHRNIDSGGMEVTKIPTGGIEINGTIYMFYFSKATWSFRSDSMNYGGCVKSTDGGVTWTKVNQLSWANHSSGTNSEYYQTDSNNQICVGNSATNIQRLMNQDISNRNTGAGIDITKHTCHFFTQIYPVDGRDGYIYLLGEGGYRTMGIKLARVLKTNFENFDSYEYFTGLNNAGEPQWLTGQAGLNALNNKAASCGFIVGSANMDDPDSGCGEQSCMYNPYLKKWIITYLQGSGVPTTNGRGIKYRLADNIWGPYTDSKTVFFSYSNAQLLTKDRDGNPVAAIYGGFISPNWVENNGQTMYAVVSQYRSDSTPILYTSNLVKVTFNPESSYEVEFNSNGGSGTMQNLSFVGEETKQLRKNTFTRTGYTFKNWNTSADGSGVTYTDEQSVSNLSGTGNTIILYAIWTQDSTPAEPDEPAEEEKTDSPDKLPDGWWEETKAWCSARWDELKSWVESLPKWSHYVAIGAGSLFLLLILRSIFKSKKKRRIKSDNLGKPDSLEKPDDNQDTEQK